MKNPYSTLDDKQTAKDCGISVAQLRADRKRDDKPLKNRIESVRIETVTDTDPDTSWIGVYSNSAETEFAIDRQERGDCERGQYRYFNPGTVEAFDPAASWIPTGTKDKRAYWHAAMLDNAAKDYIRMESLQAGNWYFVGIIAKAVVVSAQGVTQTIRSGGLWGIESDSGKDYLEETKQNELTNLRGELEAFGFGSRAIDYAFRNVETQNV